ncbi:MAG: hypothetical protein E4H08_08960 [Candidatus Atribacteria bacterium]|jgi:hypothetical protein|nr:MAG: hypothetical protein E4H08_08960 [Candidatus Atribacteria bacterium]
MAYEMSVSVHDEFIHVILVGRDTLLAAKEYWSKIAGILRANPQRKLLMEEHLVGPVPDGDIHEWSEFMRTLGIPPGTKTAFCYLKERASEYRFVETLLINRGFITKIFEDVDDARAWLLDNGAIP